MEYDDDKKTLQGQNDQQDDVATNEEYANVEDLDRLEDENGEPIDTIEQDQVLPTKDETDSGEQLRKVAEGDDNDVDDAFNDQEDKYLS